MARKPKLAVVQAVDEQIETFDPAPEPEVAEEAAQEVTQEVIQEVIQGPAPVAEPPMSAQTRAEMEAGRRAVEQFRQ